GYAGLRTAKLAKDRYSKLLAAGITSLVLSQASLNFFAVLGMAPLTGVPLPLISYGSTNLIVMMGGMGLLLNVAATGGKVATRSRRLPLALSEADGHLGFANRLLAPLARRVFLAFPLADRQGGKYVVTGRPVPAATGKVDRATARERFGIDPNERCVLIFGG